MKEYDVIIREKEDLYMLPSCLLKALIYTESDFNAKAYRYERRLHDASYGLCQLLYKTAIGIGYKGTPKDLFIPEINIDLGAKYLSKQINIWQAEKGDERIKFGLGTYNAGIGNMLQAQKSCIVKKLATDKWDSIVQVLPDITGNNASITIKYVDKIMRQREIYLKELSCVEMIKKDDIVVNNTNMKKDVFVMKFVSKVGKQLNVTLYLDGEIIDAVTTIRRELL